MTRLAILAIYGYIAWICSVHVLGAPSPDPKFEYVNIRFETNTPVDNYNNLIGGTDPGTQPGQSPDVPLLERASSSAATETDNNPFSNVAESATSEDLSRFSKDELESRRDLLLAILEQTSAQLGESTPNPERVTQPVNTTRYSQEKTKAAELDTESDASRPLSKQEYIPQKMTTQEQSEMKVVKFDDRPQTKSTSQARGFSTSLLFSLGMGLTLLFCPIS